MQQEINVINLQQLLDKIRFVVATMRVILIIKLLC